ncbi:nucleotidyltransferase [Bacillus sp. AFS054943]|uniref:Nucleotidyltransferase n=2 Tax=Bacillus cereus TaxID=1396 RepID=A0A2C1LPH7_BACCE|nr:MULTISPECIES: nucleotidyltransferase domain-containing protein [Bacillus]PGL78073.1 nucleotidyltransferase [Bacillus sp. AFS054943]PGT99859.1 nucleotidyltransferase [Bacillus cereus]TKI38693.1 nucleotidyltransferase domain-containing protein [Bacillus mycoides]
MNSDIQSELEILIIMMTNSLPAINKIILFGSHAYGNPIADSDIDLCVIVNGIGSRKRETLKILNRCLFDIMESPIDILVYGTDEFKNRAINPLTMEHDIFNKGTVVYENSH